MLEFFLILELDSREARPAAHVRNFGFVCAASRRRTQGADKTKQATIKGGNGE